MYDVRSAKSLEFDATATRGPLGFMVPLLIFMIFVPIEIPVFEVQASGGERIGVAAEHVNGVFLARRGVSATINLTDIAFALSFAILLANFVLNHTVRLPYLRYFVPVLLLIASSAIALLLNTGDLSANQKFVSSLYTTKSAIYALSFVLLAAYFGQGYSLGPIFRAMIVALIFSSVIGLATRFIPELGPLFIQDRPSFFGPALIMAMMVLFLTMNPVLMERYRINRTLAYLALFLAFIAIALSGKRAIALGLMIGIIGATYRDLGLRAFILLTLFGISALIGVDVFANKTFQTEGRLLFAYADPELQPYLLKLPYWLQTFQFAGFSVDASVSVRLARYVGGLFIGLETPVVGVGLHSGQYKAFLPDNGYIGTFMETGIVGVFLTALYVLWYMGRTRALRAAGVGKGAGGVIAAFLGLALGVQVVDVFSIVAMFLIVTVTIIHLSYLAEQPVYSDSPSV